MVYLGAAARDVHCRFAAERVLVSLLRLEGVGPRLGLCLLRLGKLRQQ
jgi:hypothetical protein